MAGPTDAGNGIAQALAKLLDVPFVVTDGTSLTEAGYVGEMLKASSNRCGLRLTET